MSLCSVITSGRNLGLYGMPRIESRLVTISLVPLIVYLLLSCFVFAYTLQLSGVTPDCTWWCSLDYMGCWGLNQGWLHAQFTVLLLQPQQLFI